MAAANYPYPILDFVLKYEGGKSNDAHDPGGRTNEGITQATYNNFRVRNGLPPRTVFEIADTERDSIYRRNYWNAICGDTLRSGEDLVVMDFAVNSGPAKALDVWRRCGGAGLSVQQVIDDVCAYRLSFLHALRTWRYFGPGWGRRVAACEALALRMAYGEKAAPGVLTRKASEAAARAAAKSTQATAGTAVSGGAALAHHASGGNAGLLLAIFIAIALMAAVFMFHSWRQRQRAAALTNAAKAIKSLPLAVTGSEAPPAAPAIAAPPAKAVTGALK